MDKLKRIVRALSAFLVWLVNALWESQFGAVTVPRGVMKLPWSLSEKTTGITLKDSVANVESEIVTYQVPRNMSVAVSAGDRFALYLRTAAPADITEGTVRVYVADANKATKFKVHESPLKAVMAGSTGGSFNVDDREKRFLFKQGFSRVSDEFLIITFEGASVADDVQTKLLLEGTQFIKL